MKKLFAVLFVAAVMVAGLFAEEFPKGTWTDPNYDAEWVIGLDIISKEKLVNYLLLCR